MADDDFGFFNPSPSPVPVPTKKIDDPVYLGDPTNAAARRDRGVFDAADVGFFGGADSNKQQQQTSRPWFTDWTDLARSAWGGVASIPFAVQGMGGDFDTLGARIRTYARDLGAGFPAGGVTPSKRWTGLPTTEEVEQSEPGWLTRQAQYQPTSRLGSIAGATTQGLGLGALTGGVGALEEAPFLAARRLAESEAKRAFIEAGQRQAVRSGIAGGVSQAASTGVTTALEDYPEAQRKIGLPLALAAGAGAPAVAMTPGSIPRLNELPIREFNERFNAPVEPGVSHPAVSYTTDALKAAGEHPDVAEQAAPDIVREMQKRGMRTTPSDINAAITRQPMAPADRAALADRLPTPPTPSLRTPSRLQRFGLGATLAGIATPILHHLDIPLHDLAEYAVPLSILTGVPFAEYGKGVYHAIPQAFGNVRARIGANMPWQNPAATLRGGIYASAPTRQPMPPGAYLWNGRYYTDENGRTTLVPGQAPELGY
jgi:hypothetical protein